MKRGWCCCEEVTSEHVVICCEDLTTVYNGQAERGLDTGKRRPSLHTLAPPQRGESNASSVEIPTMALPKDSAVASLPAVMLSSTSYWASPDAD